MKPPTLSSYHEYATDDTVISCSCEGWVLTVDYWVLELFLMAKPHLVEGYLMEHLVVDHDMTPDKAYDSVLGWGGWQ